MYLALAAIAFSMFCWFMFVLYFRKDRSRYRNCYLLSLGGNDRDGPFRSLFHSTFRKQSKIASK